MLKEKKNNRSKHHTCKVLDKDNTNIIGSRINALSFLDSDVAPVHDIHFWHVPHTGSSAERKLDHTGRILESEK
eukprot:7191588-Karenia_brevis.AAC.1